MLQFLQDGSEEVQRVALKVVRQNAAGREEEHLFVCFQLVGNVIRLTEQTVHSPIVCICQEIRNVLIDEICYLVHLFQIHLCHQVSDDVGRVCFLHILYESVYGMGQYFRIIRLRSIPVLEDGENLAGSRNVLIDLHGILVLAVYRKKVGNIFLVVQSGNCKEEYERDCYG